MSRMAVPPRLAHMILAAAACGQALRAARLAVLFTNVGLADVSTSQSGWSRLTADRSPRARAALALADRLAARASGRHARADEWDDGLILSQAYPHRIARRRDGAGGYQLANGRGVFLDPAEPLAREAWLAVAELGGGATRDRILLAARLDQAHLKGAFGDRMRREMRLAPGPGGGLRATETLWLGRLAVEERLIADPDPALIEAALLDEVRRLGVSALSWGERSAGLRRADRLPSPQGRVMAGSVGCGPLGGSGDLARAASDRQDPSGRGGRRGAGGGAAIASGLGTGPASRCRGARALDGADGIERGDRLRGRGRSARGGEGAGALRPDHAPRRRKASP